MSAIQTPHQMNQSESSGLRRFAEKDLEEWLSSPNRKPLLLRGARQSGKTWLVTHFARSHFRTILRIDFMHDRTAVQFFNGDLSPERLLNLLSAYTGLTIDTTDPHNLAHTLLFLTKYRNALVPCFR